MNQAPTGAGGSSFEFIDSERLFSELKLKEGIALLDVACGSGDYSIAASKYIGDTGLIYAIDLWKEGIDNLLSRITAQNIGNIRASVADVSKEIPIQEDCIDICLMATVLHDLIQDKSDDGTLKQVKRVLKPEGSLAVIEYKKIEGPPGPPPRIRLSPEELEKTVYRHGFRISKTMDIGPYNYLSTFIDLEKGRATDHVPPKTFVSFLKP